VLHSPPANADYVFVPECWQLASSTLDASAKIYAGRVDAIHTEVYKVLSGLGRGASESQKPPGDVISIFTVRHHASAVYAIVVSVYMSHVGVLLKQLNLGSCKQCHMIAQRL